jgi:hypothetical protein
MPAIQASEIIMYPAISQTDGDTNGGRMNHLIELPSGSLGVFPDIQEPQRLDGRVGANAVVQKLFRCVRNPENKTYSDALLFLQYPYQTAGYILELVKATHTQVWADVKTQRRYSVGTLNAAPTYNATTQRTTFLVNTLGQAFGHFVAGDDIVVTNLASAADATGTVETLICVSVTYSGTLATIICEGGLRYAYQPTRTSGGVVIPTRVASAINYGDVKCGFTTSNNTSVLGTFDASKIEPRNLGARHQTITLSFNSATAFTAVSNLSELGTLTSGSISGTWSPVDAAARQMLSVPANAWGGSWASGDSIQIHTTPPAMPVFFCTQVQAGAAAFERETIAILDIGHSSSAPV